MEDKEISIMATSSIFANIKITEPEKVEAFIDALEASIADPMPVSDIPKKAVLSNPDKIREILAKREYKK